LIGLLTISTDEVRHVRPHGPPGSGHGLVIGNQDQKIKWESGVFCSLAFSRSSRKRCSLVDFGFSFLLYTAHTYTSPFSRIGFDMHLRSVLSL
jgi:hypothetical protein